MRVRHDAKPAWYTKELQEAGYLRDMLKQHGYEEESRKLRNAINSQKRRGKTKYYRELILTNQNPKLVWRAINEITNNQSSSKSTVMKDISVEQLNTHFCTIANKVVTTDSSRSNDLQNLKQYCHDKNITSELYIPPITIFEVYHY